MADFKTGAENTQGEPLSNWGRKYTRWAFKQLVSKIVLDYNPKYKINIHKSI